MKGYYVTVRVGEKLKKYLEASYNGDIIKPPKDSTLMCIIKQHLELFSSTEDIELPENECVKIELPLQNGAVYSQSTGKVYVCNTLWRNRLSEDGQYQVKRFFENEFKKTFRTYMDCYVEQQKAKNGEDCKCKIKEGIAAFLIQYHIDFTKQDIATLARDWYRHRDKVDENKRSPCVC